MRSRPTGHLIAGRVHCLITALLLIVVLTGCGTTTALQHARQQHLSGDSTAALKTLSSSEVVEPRSRLLYWMEKGLVLHETGDFGGSAQELLAASRYLDENDYISLRDETRELLANEWAGDYAGEYSERLWIHSYLMMNFLALGQYESAAVEARQALAEINSQPDILQQDHFTRALIALSFEAAGQLNSSYIEYRKLAEDTGPLQGLDQILLTQATRLGFSNDAQEIKQRLLKTDSSPTSRDPLNPDDTILFVSSGQIPAKVSGSIITSNASRLSFPQYYLQNRNAPEFTVLVNGAPCDCQPIHSNLGNLVSESLDKRGLSMATKSIFRAATKDAVADAVGDENEIMGELTRLLLFALEEADTRSWQSLPHHLTLVRIPRSVNGSAPLIEIRANHRTVTRVEAPAAEGSSSGLRFVPIRLPR